MCKICDRGNMRQEVAEGRGSGFDPGQMTTDVTFPLSPVAIKVTTLGD